MPDREKVITHFRDAIEALGDVSNWRFVHVDILKEAVELLKAQEPVTPICKSDMLFCGACRYAIPNTVNYCPRCGRKVDWDASDYLRH